MAWFFASSATFQNANDETINNAPINLDVAITPTITTHQPEGTTLALYAISFLVDSIATTLYLCYPNQAARDADYALLLVQVALPAVGKVGSHTADTFVNGSGETITNKNFNLDISATYYKTRAKPPFSSEILYAISLVFKNKNKPEYLYYEDEAARDADHIVIQNTVAAINTSISISQEATNVSITGSDAGAWVTRTLAVGANKVVQIRANKIVLNPDGYTVGVRAVGSTEPPVNIGNCAFYKNVMTDGNGDIEIYSTNLNMEFSQTDILSIS